VLRDLWRILLTATGETLVEPLGAIRDWAEKHIEGILGAQAASEAPGSRSS
jgi:DNA-binding HxlR family transcriptional regulator